MAKRIKPGHTELRKFLASAVTDPNKDAFIKRIVIEGRPDFFEYRTIEFMEEAGRLRDRIEKGDTGLVEDYIQRMRQAATFASIAAGIMAEKYQNGPDPAQSQHSAGSENPT